MKSKETKEPDRRYTVENLEINTVYILSMAIERIVDDIERRLLAQKCAFRMEKKMRINNILKAIRNIKMQLFLFIVRENLQTFVQDHT